MKFPKRAIIVSSVLLVISLGQNIAENPPKKQEDSPNLFVQVNGKTFTILDVEKEMSQEYSDFVQETNDRIFQLLETLGVRKMLILEAKEKQLTLQEYSNQIHSSAKIPSESELKDLYQQLKDDGQISDTFEKARPQLLDYLVTVNQENVMRDEINRLKKKYKYVAKRPNILKEADIQGEPTRGGKNAKITIVEFSDFECPFCLKSQEVNREIRKKYGDKIKWVFKDFPLSFHSKAMGAHIAANCVFRQSPEKYWSYFDMLFAEVRPQEILTPAWLEQKAKDLKLDMPAYKACLKDESVQKEIEGDITEAARLGIKGTPTFIINGRMLEGAQPAEVFESYFDSE
ncbi:hypothetical protein EHQ53_08735 [Leptospira langatensis]|uniref:Thioredoxin domain-containing protein n=1 Tax=Leptospira langatensis TaxID=2484983 RepID=A0A5F1ZVG8_9LEPT|nr:thioredoxin domain-containing protein [Leptospira langatensis]TGK01285.1 hypothetical protein EHO57_10135 [Leptospira langatensis]TGL42262.1 hypothetical protein EHQ53_08735 [Leptospira langatensis]